MVVAVPEHGQPQVNDKIEALRRMVKDEKDLYCTTDDEFLLRYLKACHFNVDKSFQLVQDYFKAKLESPEAFYVKNVECHRRTITRLDLGYLLHRVDSLGRRVVHIRIGAVDPTKDEWEDIMQTLTIGLETLSLLKDVQDNGLALLLDCTGFTLKLMKWVTPYKIRVILKFLQDCIPCRFEVFHVVNAPFVFNFFFSSIKPFLNRDLQRKIVWHRTPFKELHSSVGEELLPEHLGGCLDLNQVSDWFKVYDSKTEQHFQSLKTMGYTKKSR